MKKRKHLKEIAEASRQNPVAKFARHFNKGAVFADKRKYCRKTKHAGQEVFPSALIGVFGNTSC